MTWYYTRNGQQLGPCNEDELRRLVAEGAVAPTDMVWKAGMQGWAAASSVFPPPVPAGGPPLPPAPPAYAPPAYAPAYAPPPPGYPQPYAAGYAVPKQRVAYVLLGVFLGCLGIHNFYAGYNGRAIAQLLITVFLFWLIVPLIAVSIWAIVEVIVVDRDPQGRPFV